MLLTIIIFITTLGVLVISHELGHFLAARRFGVKVLEFGFGLPPKIWSKKFGETKFSLNALPIGGFVKLLGEDEIVCEQSIGGSDQSRNFSHKPVVQRILIVGAGVVVNLILSWVLFYIVLFNQNWKIIYPSLEPVVVVADLQDNFPAKTAGVKIGEQLLQIDDQPVQNLDSAVKYIRGHANLPIKLKLSDLEGRNLRDVTLTPKELNPGDGRIGVVFSPIPFREYESPLSRIFSAPAYSWDLIKLTFQGLGKLVANIVGGNYQIASQSVAGPIGLIQVTHGFVASGWQAVLPYLWFVGVISLTLTIFNSLPFPALDGGRILFMIWELVSGRRVNQNFEKWAHSVGMVILLGLMLLITLSDLSKLNLF